MANILVEENLVPTLLMFGALVKVSAGKRRCTGSSLENGYILLDALYLFQTIPSKVMLKFSVSDYWPLEVSRLKKTLRGTTQVDTRSTRGKIFFFF